MTPELKKKLAAAGVVVLLALGGLGNEWHSEKTARQQFKADLVEQGLALEEARVALRACIASDSTDLGAELRAGLRSLLPSFLVE